MMREDKKCDDALFFSIYSTRWVWITKEAYVEHVQYTLVSIQKKIKTMVNDSIEKRIFSPAKSKLIFAVCEQMHSMWSMECSVKCLKSTLKWFDALWGGWGIIIFHFIRFHYTDTHLRISFTEIINGVFVYVCARMMFDMQIVATHNELYMLDLLFQLFSQMFAYFCITY